MVLLTKMMVVHEYKQNLINKTLISKKSLYCNALHLDKFSEPLNQDGMKVDCVVSLQLF